MEKRTTAGTELVVGRPVDEIVVPVATGSYRERAMPFAAGLADAWSLPIRVVHVSASITSDDPDLESIVERLRPWYPTVRIESTHLYGDDPARAVADSLGPNSLAVMSTENTDGWRFKDSTAEAVVTAAGVPVLLVGPEARTPNLGGDVVLGLDGSASAEEALESAVGLAEALGGRLWLVGVVDKPQAGRPDPNPDLARYLHEIAARLDRWVRARWEVVQSNDPVDALTSFARRRRAGFMVTATGGRSDATSHTMRSIAMGLVPVAPCPVLISQSSTD